MIDHFGISCADLDASKTFYDTVLATLGHTRVEDFADSRGPGAQYFPEYHASYFGDFVRDPDGNNVEAVCHRFPRED